LLEELIPAKIFIFLIFEPYKLLSIKHFNFQCTNKFSKLFGLNMYKKVLTYHNLKILYLIGNNISDIKPLENLKQLKTLALSDNNISDIKPLANLIQLETLALGYNNISDIKPLANLTQLRFLALNDNNLFDVKI